MGVTRIWASREYGLIGRFRCLARHHRGHAAPLTNLVEHVGERTAAAGVSFAAPTGVRLAAAAGVRFAAPPVVAVRGLLPTPAPSTGQEAPRGLRVSRREAQRVLRGLAVYLDARGPGTPTEERLMVQGGSPGRGFDSPGSVLGIRVLLVSGVLADVPERAGVRFLVALPPVVLAVEVEEVVVEALAVQVVAGAGARRRGTDELQVGVLQQWRALDGRGGGRPVQPAPGTWYLKLKTKEAKRGEAR